jgi:hypothetical protein
MPRWLSLVCEPQHARALLPVQLAQPSTALFYPCTGKAKPYEESQTDAISFSDYYNQTARLEAGRREVIKRKPDELSC